MSTFLLFLFCLDEHESNALKKGKKMIRRIVSLSSEFYAWEVESNLFCVSCEDQALVSDFFSEGLEVTPGPQEPCPEHLVRSKTVCLLSLSLHKIRHHHLLLTAFSPSPASP